MATHKEEIRDLANYVRGMADGQQNSKLQRAAYWLEKLAHADVCGGGFIGCTNGDNCASSHK